MFDLILASSNVHKVTEIQSGLKHFQVKGLKEVGFSEEIEETGKTFLENAAIKARVVHQKFPHHWVLADDSGLEVDALDGRPGIYSARYPGVPNPTNEQFCSKILNELKQVPDEKRSARFVCAMLLISPQGKEYEVEETVEGFILHEMRGENGFGYDPIFFYPPKNCTTAELDLEEKNKISHRGKAVAQVTKILNNQIESGD